jgi:hypothetical protein
MVCAQPKSIKALAFRSSCSFVPPFKLPSNIRPMVKDISESAVSRGLDKLDADTALARQWWIQVVSILFFFI